MTSEWVAIALLGKPRGNRGELTAIVLTNYPERFQSLKRVFLFGAGQQIQVEEAWFHQGSLVLKFAGVDSISDAEKLYGFEVRIPAAERIALDAGEYFHSDLIGCLVRDRSTGREIGRVKALQELTGAGVLELEDGVLIPFARQICVAIEPQNRLILVDLPEGLLEVNLP